MWDFIRITLRMWIIGSAVAVLILNWNPKAIWAFPVGVIAGFLSEWKFLTGKNN